MTQLFLILIIIMILLCLAYLLLISSYCYGWIKTKPFGNSEKAHILVSVIIPARNEEQTIINCLTSIVNQNYPNQCIEIIVVDDASTDSTNKNIQRFLENYSWIRLITLKDHQGGKKNAIRAAIEDAKGELMVTTDADCIMGENWLSTLVNFYQQSQAKMIVAPVSFYEERTIFEKMQSLEFMALIASAGGSIYFNKAIMCNGANLAYTKKVFKEVNGFDDIDKSASGDDVLLMYKIKQLYPEGICFLKNRETIVYTKAKPTLKEFIDQRKRWVSKDFSLLNIETKIVSLMVYFFNFMLLILPITAFFCLPNTPFRLAFFEICLIIIAFKAIIDFLLLFLAASFFKKENYLIYFLPEQFMYILYVAVVGLLGITKEYKWKDRNIHG
ncbi:MAG: glycosyltransferase [Bacteroidota bacterium]